MAVVSEDLDEGRPRQADRGAGHRHRAVDVARQTLRCNTLVPEPASGPRCASESVTPRSVAAVGVSRAGRRPWPARGTDLAAARRVRRRLPRPAAAPEVLASVSLDLILCHEPGLPVQRRFEPTALHLHSEGGRAEAEEFARLGEGEQVHGRKDNGYSVNNLDNARRAATVDGLGIETSYNGDRSFGRPPASVDFIRPRSVLNPPAGGVALEGR